MMDPAERLQRMEQLRARAKADPAIRDGWVKMHDNLFDTFDDLPHLFDAPGAHLSESWRDVALVTQPEGEPPYRQELEWLRAMLDLRQSTFRQAERIPDDVADALFRAIDELRVTAPVGPSSERYL